MTRYRAVRSRLHLTFPHLHFVVNAAGIIRRDEEFELEVFEQVTGRESYRRNAGMHRSPRPHLARTRGCYRQYRLYASFFGGPRVPAYSASKGGVAQLTKSLALAWAADGIRVNAVAPGWIATPLTEALQQDADRSAQLLSRTAMNRWGRPEEIAGPVLFLCSELASFMTGAVIPSTAATRRHKIEAGRSCRLLTHCRLHQIVTQAVPDDERIWVPTSPERLVPAADAEHIEWPMVQPAARPSGGHPQPASSPRAGTWLRNQGIMAIPGARLGGRAGDYVFEPPGETHTLTVDADVEEMITFFNISGCMYYVDERATHGLRGRVHKDRHVPEALYRGWPGRGLRRSVRSLSSRSPRICVT